ncbi:MAG: Spx/MgsR family RNA polymerase-binding regulatory protein [Halothiobacillaceae bacterium]|nr:Spx/MgsR family RNA polymerase-binding regulatory protein [Halothiobacillaceae bacterium]
MMSLFGIPACDSVKKARTWLDQRALAYQFHDYKKAGVPEDLLDRWLAELGWDAVINTRGTSWRALPQSERLAMDNAAARRAVLINPSLIKRPILVTDTQTWVGFEPDRWQREVK